MKSKNKKDKKNKKEENISNDDRCLNLKDMATPDDKGREEGIPEDKNAKEEEYAEDVQESLSEIYQDENGDKIDVAHIKKTKKSNLVFSFYIFLFFAFILIIAGVSGYFYIYSQGNTDDNIQFSIEGPDKVSLNEEFFYKIKYFNKTNTYLEDTIVYAKYPDNFVFTDSFPVRDEDNENEDAWKLDKIPPKAEGEIKIKGRIIDRKGESQIFLSRMEYTPGNFSSEFTKEASCNTQLSEIGLDMDITKPATVLVGEKTSMGLNFELAEDSFVSHFVLSVEGSEDMDILDFRPREGSDSDITIDGTAVPGKWEIGGVREGDNRLDMDFVYNKKPSDKIIKFSLNKTIKDKEYEFINESVEMDIIKSDFDLSMFINGSFEDAPVDFGETLHYTINYGNKGETALENIVIMAVLESDFLDWTTLNDENMGTERGNTIVWTEDQIPQLSRVGPGDEGEINFSIDVASFTFDGEIAEKKAEVRSYVQYNIKKILETPTSTDALIPSATSSVASTTLNNKSNVIVNKINSDLKAEESVRYFNEDNIPVGSGPLPPQVGKETRFKVYWNVKNNLHELEDIEMRTKLPKYIKWSGKSRTSVGTIQYSSSTREIVWDVGRLPVAVYRADAEFDIILDPRKQDANKILVLTSGSEVKATDVETEDEITASINPSTTKLEDDEIAQMSNDGIVRER